MNTSPSSRTFLKLFGTPSVRSADGVPLSGRVAQRHRLALLSLVATAGAQGVSRERVMAALWPESDQERSRNLLKVSVYVLRQALGEDALLSEGDELRLNPERVEVDVSTFEAALASGDHERAISVNDAPFLEGFFLSEAPDFERWVARERERLASARSTALEALAVAAQRRGDLLDAVKWWKARAAQDPLDSRVALHLMHVLEASGNPAGALKHATIHERLLHEELGIGVAPEVTALVQRLRVGRESSVIPFHGEVTGITAQPNGPSVTDDPGIEGGLRENENPKRMPPPARRRRLHSGLWYAGAAISVMVVFLLVNRPRAVSPAAERPSIAVLPLRNLSAEPSDSLLADLLTEELISTLGRDPDRLRVIASTSVFQFRGAQLDVREIAGRLQVAHVLEGNLQKSDTRIRVRLRLVDGQDGTTRWSQTFDREYSNLLALQEIIAGAVALELDVRLADMAGSSPLPDRAPGDSLSARRLAAFELYLAGNDKRLLRSETAARRGLDLFKQAVRADSTYAAAHAGLARMYQRISNYEDLSRRDRLAMAEQHARKAVSLDGQLAEAHASLGLVLMSQLRFESAEAALVRAVQLDPVSAISREFLMVLYSFTRRPEEALAAARMAVRIDPQSVTARGLLAQALLQTDRCEEALEELKQIAHLQPPLLRAAIIKAHCYAVQEKWQEAIDVLRPDSANGGPLRLANLGFMLAQAGQTAEAQRILAALRERANRGDAYFVAVLYAGLRDFDRAFEWLDRAAEDGSLHHQILLPAFKELQRDPRFDRMWTRLGVQKR